MECYESLGPVGEGSYGTVLKCRHRESGRLVAIKKFMDSDEDKTVKKIALREIKLLRQLRHDNLVNLLMVWKRRRRWYLVFEFVDRTLLEDLEQNPNGLDLNTCRQYMFQILRAATFCHQQNVIHRDIKPENILISQEGVVKLCDFGFARTIASPSEVYTDYVATRWYRAPELLVGDIKYGKPVDVWALGCLLIEVLTGQPLFPGDSDLDQIYHIIKCFGNLVTHHQELFYRNPIFSGVKLPESSSTVPLQQRFPSIAQNALDVAQMCLEMDPEGRAQCSELLDHLFFTQDSFHIRFLEQLNAKIQKEHIENSTLPKITRRPGQERSKVDEKNSRGKDKKHPEDVDEKVNKDKIEKMKGKQLSKVSKHIQNTINSSGSKQPKTPGNKGTLKTEPCSVNPEKPEAKKESEVSTKSFNSKSEEDSKITSQKKKDSLAIKPKFGRVLTPDPRKNLLQNVKDFNFSGLNAEKNMMRNRSFCKSETNQEFAKTWSNPNLKVSKMSISSITESPGFSSSPKTALESGLGSPMMLCETRSLKLSPSSEHQTSDLRSDDEQKTSLSPKVLPQNPTTIKTTFNDGPKADTTISSQTLDISEQPYTVVTKSSPVLNMAALPTGTSHFKATKDDFTLKDNKLLEDNSVGKQHGYLKMNPVTEPPAGSILLSQASRGDPESSRQHNPKVATEQNITSTQVLNKRLSLRTTVLKTLKVSDKENQDDLAPLSGFRKSKTNPFNNQTLRVSGNSSYTQKDTDESSAKSFRVPRSKQDPSKTGSFSDHMRPSMTPRSQKPTFVSDAKRKSDKKEANISRDLTPTVLVDQRASTRNFSHHHFGGFDLNESQLSTPSPPRTSSSNLMLLPPSSQSLIPPYSIFSTKNPAANDHILQGGAFHPGTNSLRCGDKPQQHGGAYDREVQKFTTGHVTGSFTCQVPEHRLMSEKAKNKPHVHFPDVRSSALPELKEGKPNKGSIRNVRKETNPVSSSLVSDVQQQQGPNVNTNTPQKMKETPLLK